MNLSPIALFVYKRLDHTRQTVNSLLANAESKNCKLYIFSDAPKTEKDEFAVGEVRKYIDSISGFAGITIIKQEINRGLANSIISGVTDVLSKNDTVIVVEDDLLLSPFFLRYMNEALQLYQEEKTVASIHGYTYPLSLDLPETFFLKGADCWGWATWKDRWNFFEPDSVKLLNQIQQTNLTDAFDYGGYAGNIKMLNNQISGKIDSWAIRWHAVNFLANKYTLFPGTSLVQNIGMDGGGTHGAPTDVFKVSLANRPLKLEKVEIKENEQIVQAMRNYFKTSKLSLLSRVLSRANKLFRG